jgi:hypothetical protein
VSSNRKDTIGVYYSLTKNLMLLAEGSRVETTAQAPNSLLPSNKATTVNIGAYLGF